MVYWNNNLTTFYFKQQIQLFKYRTLVCIWTWSYCRNCQIQIREKTAISKVLKWKTPASIDFASSDPYVKPICLYECPKSAKLSSFTLEFEAIQMSRPNPGPSQEEQFMEGCSQTWYCLLKGSFFLLTRLKM